MLPVIALLLCAMDITTAHLMSLTHDEYAVMYQAYIALLCLGAVISDKSQRDRSILSVLLIWAFWILVTDQFNVDVPDVVLSLEAAFFTSFVLWAIARPHFYVSENLMLRSENVYIGFYHGSHAPLLSSLGALFGLPFSSIIIVAGETVLRSSGCGKMVINSAAAISPDDYTFIDTGKKATTELFEEIAACSGLPTKAFGIFRTKCICNCELVLSLIGLKPKSWFHRMPSIFYYQCVRQANG